MVILNMMNRYKRIGIILFSLQCYFFHSVFAQIKEPKEETFKILIKSSADTEWEKMPNVSNYPIDTTQHQSASVLKIARIEIVAKETRNWAIKFISEYPNDRRKYNALRVAMDARVFYWKEPIKSAELYIQYKGKVAIPINKEEQSAWTLLYPKFRKEYLNSSDVSEVDKLSFKKYEFFAMVLGVKNWDGDRLLPITLLNAFEEAVLATQKLNPKENNYSKKGGGNVFTGIEAIFTISKLYGWDNDDIRTFIEMASESSVDAVKEWGQRRMAFINLKNKGFDFKHEDVDGTVVDLKKYKGKVVLLDFWATWCSGCISGMENVKKVYEKLHHRGFEVISISINSEMEKKEVLKVKDRIGFSWPLAIIGGNVKNDSLSLYKRIFSEYGFRTVPQLILIDKNGRIVEYKGVLGTDLLYDTVKKYL